MQKKKRAQRKGKEVESQVANSQLSFQLCIRAARANFGLVKNLMNHLQMLEQYSYSYVLLRIVIFCFPSLAPSGFGIE